MTEMPNEDLFGEPPTYTKGQPEGETQDEVTADE